MMIEKTIIVSAGDIDSSMKSTLTKFRSKSSNTSCCPKDRSTKNHPTLQSLVSSSSSILTQSIQSSVLTPSDRIFESNSMPNLTASVRTPSQLQNLQGSYSCTKNCVNSRQKLRKKLKKPSSSSSSSATTESTVSEFQSNCVNLNSMIKSSSTSSLAHEANVRTKAPLSSSDSSAGAETSSVKAAAKTNDIHTPADMHSFMVCSPELVEHHCAITVCKMDPQNQYKQLQHMQYGHTNCHTDEQYSNSFSSLLASSNASECNANLVNIVNAPSFYFSSNDEEYITQTEQHLVLANRNSNFLNDTTNMKTDTKTLDNSNDKITRRCKSMCSSTSIASAETYANDTNDVKTNEERISPECETQTTLLSSCTLSSNFNDVKLSKKFKLKEILRKYSILQPLLYLQLLTSFFASELSVPLPSSPSSSLKSTSNSQNLHPAKSSLPKRQPHKFTASKSFLSFELLVAVYIATIVLLLAIGSRRIGVMALQPEPMFVSRSETFKFVAGSTIELPCEVANTAEYVVAWKRGIAILSAGLVKVTPDPRVKLVNGFNLQIRDAVPQDAGDYICQIAMLEPREITHTVEILVPPRIHHISSGGHLQVKKGASVRIECSASGNPTPNVTWSRKNNILPNGDERLHSSILSLENMDRHKGGVYICTANNGVGNPASSQVVMHVLYPPEITVERPVVFSGEGHEAMLVCIVHGEAQPEVIWFKETMQLDTTERHIMENRGSRHTLIIRKVHPQDFGNYSCVAENQLGKSRKTLQLSGKPSTAIFSSPPISQYKDRYNISWTVDSHSPVEEFKLFFRRLPQGHEVDNTIDQSQPLHLSSSTSQMMYSSSSSSHMHRGGYNAHWPRNDWRDVVLPAVPLSHHYTQGMSYMIRGLDPDQHYEARVQARNRYGWGDMTESFLFSTSSNDAFLDHSSYRNLGYSDNEMRDLSVTYYGNSSPSFRFIKSINFKYNLCLITILFLIKSTLLE